MAMFSLRNIGTTEAAIALADGKMTAFHNCHPPIVTGLECKESALFRHEIAYVLGQLQNPAVIDQLQNNLQQPTEHYMVRHECAETLGSIGSDKSRDILLDYIDDPERVVRESVQVALDMHDYERSGLFQYAHINCDH